MRIRVESILEGGKSIEGTVEPSSIPLDEPCYRLAEPLTFTGRATRSGEDVYVEGTLAGSVEAQCSRCLENFALPLDVSLDVMFVPEQESEDAEEDMFESETHRAYYSGESIDLLEQLRDIILVNLPIKPICRSDCKGLCPQCGADLNREPCTCERSTGPSPFDKLKDLKL
jgi:uncharacterized protein